MVNKPFRITGFMVIPFEAIIEAKDELEAFEKLDKKDIETFQYFENSYTVKPYKKKDWLIYPITGIELEYRLDSNLILKKNGKELARERAEKRQENGN